LKTKFIYRFCLINISRSFLIIKQFNFFYEHRLAALLILLLVSQSYSSTSSLSMQLSTIKLLLTSACCFGSLFAVGSACYLWLERLTPQIAYIDTDRLLDSYQAMVTARHQYQREKQEWQQNLATLTKEAQQAATQVQQAGKSTDPTGKRALEREAQLKREQLLNYQQAVVKQEPEEMQRLTQPVIASVNHYIAAYSREHRYSLVLTTAGQGDVVYSDSKLDITADITKNINKYLADSLAQTSGAGNVKKLIGRL
jgi:outer membrane protein